MIELIPAIDVMDGKCVRLTQGDYQTKKVYDEDPLEAAKRFEGHGMRRLHIVDLDGARAGRVVNHKILERVAGHTGLVIDYGGGLKRDEDLRVAFESGAQMVTGGSIAVKDRDGFLSWLERYGSDRIILGADARDRKVAVGGWEEGTELDLIPFIRDYARQGIRKVICTDIGRDGMLQGPAVGMYQEIQGHAPEIYLMASGGVGSADDIRRLEEAGIPAVIFGKAVYEGRIRLEELERFDN